MRLPAFFSIFTLLAVTGCETAPAEEECLVVEPSAFFALDRGLVSSSTRGQTPVGELVISLYAGPYVVNPDGAILPPVTGDVDFGDTRVSIARYLVEAVDVNYVEDVPSVEYLPVGGILHMEVASDPVDGTFVGEFRNVRLQEARWMEAEQRYFVVEGGRCITFSASFDTRPLDGTPCGSPRECGNPTQRVCDVVTRTCVAPQCRFDGSLSCPTGQSCVGQDRILIDQEIGVCLPACVGGACSAGTTCIDPNYIADQTTTDDEGICLPLGTAELGADCERSAVETGCVEGSTCSGDEDTGFRGTCVAG